MLNVELCHTFIKKLHLYRIEQNLIQAPKDFWIFEHLRRLGFCTYPHIVLKLKITQDHPPPPTPFLSKLEFHLLLLSLVTGESMGLISAISVSGESAKSPTLRGESLGDPRVLSWHFVTVVWRPQLDFGREVFPLLCTWIETTLLFLLPCLIHSGTYDIPNLRFSRGHALEPVVWKKWETHVFQNTGSPGCSSPFKRWRGARDDWLGDRSCNLFGKE